MITKIIMRLICSYRININRSNTHIRIINFFTINSHVDEESTLIKDLIRNIKLERPCDR